MSNFEIFLIVIVCAIPFVALMFVLPKIKFKKKVKNIEPQPVKTYEEIKKEEQKQEPKEKVQQTLFANRDITDDEFKGFINSRHKDISKPQKVDLPDDFLDRTMPYMPFSKKKKNKHKSVAEELRSLSPELKALIISGALDKKNFD